LPSLLLNYLGQGAILIESPESIINPFFSLFPKFLTLPMVALATFAAIIASQAIISGAFSLTAQAVHLGFIPRLCALGKLGYGWLVYSSCSVF
ncbi:Potassium transporter like protein, partial [Aduncisulcus paluster]